MTRFVYEFFRPRLSLPVVIPIGVLAQDDEQVVYRAIPFDYDVVDAFYDLPKRESLMNNDLLLRVERVTEGGERERLSPTDPDLLNVVVARGVHHFIYSDIDKTDDPALSFATNESDRVAHDPERRKALARGVADPATRALLDAAYG